MRMLSEKELQEYMKSFNNKNVVFSFGGIVRARIVMKNAECVYYRKVGILKVNDSNTELSIDISSAYKILTSENNTMLKIYLDNELEIIIEK